MSHPETLMTGSHTILRQCPECGETIRVAEDQWYIPMFCDGLQQYTRKV